MRGKSLIWTLYGGWLLILLIGLISTQSTWHQFGGELIEEFGAPPATLAAAVSSLGERIGLDLSGIAETYARFDGNRSGVGTSIQHINPFHPSLGEALLYFGTWALLGLILASILVHLFGGSGSNSASSTPTVTVVPSAAYERQYGDRAMLIFLIGVAVALGVQYLLNLPWLSATVLLAFSALALQRYLNRQRLERFKVVQLVDLVTGLRNQNRTEVAMVKARVEHEVAEQRRMTGKLWVSAPSSIPLVAIEQVVKDTQAYVDKAHEPREQLAIELERWRVQNQYDYARHVREIKRLAIDNQQKRWELITREVTELRKVMVAATEEIARNPALGMRLHDMFMHINEFQSFMEDMKSEGRMDDSKAGQMMDELFSRTFEAQVDELLKPNRPNGAGAFSRN